MSWTTALPVLLWVWLWAFAAVLNEHEHKVQYHTEPTREACQRERAALESTDLAYSYEYPYRLHTSECYPVPDHDGTQP